MRTRRFSLIALVVALLLGATAPTAAAPTTRVWEELSVADWTALAGDDADVARQRLGQVTASRAAVEQVLDIGLSNEEAGEFLREARRRVPDASSVAARVRDRERQLAEARLSLVRLIDERRLASTPAEQALALVYLAEQTAYVAAVEDALAAERDLARESAAIARRLDEELLWIGSAPPIGRAWAADVVEGVRWGGDPLKWFGVGRTLLGRFADVPLGSACLALAVAGLLLGQLRIRRALAATGAAVGRYATDSFLLTVRALLLTALLALPLPLILLGVGGLLGGASPGFATAVGRGLTAAGAVWLLLGFFRHLCRPGGLVDAHFGWDAAPRGTLFRHLGWLIPVQVAASFVVATCDAGGDEVYQQGLGRLGFLVGSAALTLFVALVFRPGRGVLSTLLDRDGWAWRLRRAWYALLVGLPAALTLAAAAGYYYTAIEVQRRFFTTGVVVLLGIIAYSLATRWLLVARRHLAVRQARERLAERREQRERAAADAPEAATGEATPELDAAKVDVEAASAQTLTLLRTGVTVGVLALLWGVWADVLPALAVLDGVTIVDPTRDADGVVIVPAVTLWSLALAAVVLALTAIAAKNLPAVLELAVLQRFPIDAGARYAAVTLVRYAVIAIGLVWASDLIGIRWGKAQWIVAALGVGLGFGLQEIVANFVSGLIILFERPVRVGDVVTVGNVSGTVSRLKIRATTITDWDSKEVLVPNKSFITDPVVNWTLSSGVTRLLVPIGVAYGSDTALVQRTIAGVVESIPTVLADPPPSVLFVGFGDSALNFEIRAFVGQLSQRLTTLHEMHVRTDAALREAGIEIPFPQRDVHVRSGSLTPPVG